MQCRLQFCLLLYAIYQCIAIIILFPKSMEVINKIYNGYETLNTLRIIGCEIHKYITWFANRTRKYYIIHKNVISQVLKLFDGDFSMYTFTGLHRNCETLDPNVSVDSFNAKENVATILSLCGIDWQNSITYELIRRLSFYFCI